MTQKSVFWQALILALLVFGTGMILGYTLENSRTNKIALLYEKSELDLLDMRIQGDIISLPIGCRQLVEENQNFAERIYQEAKILDNYEQAAELSESVRIQHKKYDLLRVLFWTNSIQIKERCGNPFDTVVYIYNYNTEDLSVKAKQSVISRALSEIKEEYGSSIMLIPLAGNNNLSSVNSMLQLYNISQTNLPVVIINEKDKIIDPENKQEIAKYLQNPALVKLN